MDTSLGQPIASGRTAEIYAWGESRVLKLFRPGFMRGAAEYEFNLVRAIDACNLPVPCAFDLIEVQGRPGIVYARVNGISMLRELSARPWRAIAIARRLAELHTLIHQLPPISASGLPRQRERLIRQLSEAPLTDLQKDAIGRQLARLPDGNRLCHGDFHPDNVLVTPNGEMVIDWTNASVGNPLGDVAWTSLVLCIGDPPAGFLRLLIRFVRHWFHQAYIKRYSQLNPDARAQLGAWRLPMAVARLRDNIPSERATLLSTIAELAQQ